ncbi:hypothetical protein [Rhodococcus sovatensis]|uniref:DUF7159 domain-containing protein n=1 Tax=Rhodococcus sovatensis TaxID=1805840 RepID=A0ABZ2PLC4_9NOCA
MATIGLSIESGAMNAVLFDLEADAVVATQVTSLEGDESSSLRTAVEAMTAVAARRSMVVDAVGLVYRSADERDRLVAAIEASALDNVQLVSASTAILGWLARSPDFEFAECVLLYYIGPSGVALSLADSANASLSSPKTATLDSMSPERIGSTVPLAWEVLDEAGRKPDAVALFGDRSGSRDLIDILALGLGVPVVRVSDSAQIAACGAGLAAAGDPEMLAAPIAEGGAAASSEPPLAARVPSVPSIVMAPEEISVRRTIARKKLVLTAAVLAGVLSGGVALASTLPQGTTVSNEASEPEAEATGIDASLAGATQSVEVTPPAPPVAPAPPMIIDPVTQQPVVAEAPAVEWTIDPTTGVARPREGFTPIPAAAIPPAAAVIPRQTVVPPVFAVPTYESEPGKSEEQLQQEAWDEHWAHTAAWLQQEIVGN